MRLSKSLLIGTHFVAATIGALFVVGWAYLPFGVKTSCTQQKSDISANGLGDVLAIRHSLCGGVVFSSTDEILLKTHLSQRYETVLSFEHGDSEPALKWVSDKEILVSVRRPGEVYKQIENIHGIKVKFDVLNHPV
jgi:hypothetical protein